MSWSPATAPLPRVPRWRPAWPPIMPTSTRCGEERNRPTRAWVKTGSPALTSRTWSRPDTQPDELSASSRHGRHPLVTRTAVSSAPSGTRAYTAVVSGVLRPLNSPLHGMHAHRPDEHAQTSRPEHGGRHSLGPPGTQTSQKQHAGLLELDAQPSAVSIRLP